MDFISFHISSSVLQDTYFVIVTFESVAFLKSLHIRINMYFLNDMI